MGYQHLSGDDRADFPEFTALAIAKSHGMNPVVRFLFGVIPAGLLLLGAAFGWESSGRADPKPRPPLIYTGADGPVTAEALGWVTEDQYIARQLRLYALDDDALLRKQMGVTQITIPGQDMELPKFFPQSVRDETAKVRADYLRSTDTPEKLVALVKERRKRDYDLWFATMELRHVAQKFIERAREGGVWYFDPKVLQRCVERELAHGAAHGRPFELALTGCSLAEFAAELGRAYREYPIVGFGAVSVDRTIKSECERLVRDRAQGRERFRVELPRAGVPEDKAVARQMSLDHLWNQVKIYNWQYGYYQHHRARLLETNAVEKVLRPRVPRPLVVAEIRDVAEFPHFDRLVQTLVNTNDATMNGREWLVRAEQFGWEFGWTNRVLRILTATNGVLPALGIDWQTLPVTNRYLRVEPSEEGWKRLRVNLQRIGFPGSNFWAWLGPDSTDTLLLHRQAYHEVDRALLKEIEDKHLRPEIERFMATLRDKHPTVFPSVESIVSLVWDSRNGIPVWPFNDTPPALRAEAQTPLKQPIAR